MKPRDLFRHFKEMQKYFIAAALVFLAGFVLGYADSAKFETLLQSQIQGLQQLARSIAAKDHSMLWLFGFIFLNNALKSIFIVFAGIFFGVLPLFFLLVNGLVLGYLASLQVQGDQLAMFLKGILPHGILEIPAIVIACAYGIRLGAIMGKGFLRLPSSQGRQVFVVEFKRFMQLSVPLMGLLVVTLLTAAIIESTITPWLIGK
ncbi:stage II sporulation protein M [Paenibacillus ginsengarvi]|uniref:Stage II sporulation protein M n=1 Tax=Paenibacillus ginsengarvi TaxID=400777 RepID=A0A3B0AXW3_9BACL|nr:stage II sporulation protein M [Paenibacillus ginsengarvi]RKN65232.1 stage II sporulation protein M [Paenibacillus ginsengarvi]